MVRQKISTGRDAKSLFCMLRVLFRNKNNYYFDNCKASSGEMVLVGGCVWQVWAKHFIIERLHLNICQRMQFKEVLCVEHGTRLHQGIELPILQRIRETREQRKCNMVITRQ